MENIVLIDGNYWLFSAFHATAAMGNLMVNKEWYSHKCSVWFC